jgi:16S rRNA (guanine966-N2)-methyltransferase
MVCRTYRCGTGGTEDVRVISGRLGGRVFDAPGTNKTHPMSEKMCGALFNILGDITDLTVLDAFAGTGALSFEAVSRGAAHAVAIESDRTASQTISRNIEKLGLGDNIQLVQVSNTQWMQTNSGALFDLVFCDPPYDDLQPETITKLALHAVAGGILVVSWPGASKSLMLPGLEQIEQRAYGDAQLIFYRA